METDPKLHKQRRIQRNLRHQQRQLRIAKLHNLPQQSPHYYNKHNVMDCGNPKCPTCSNPRQRLGTPTIEEQRWQQLDILEDLYDTTNTTSSTTS